MGFRVFIQARRDGFPEKGKLPGGFERNHPRSEVARMADFNPCVFDGYPQREQAWNRVLVDPVDGTALREGSGTNGPRCSSPRPHRGIC
jgi:hypothetical protein